ncbi:MAG: hypothetical protein GXO88_11405 [Chlorobi bacterium]|nr:hypothetical protein [Chlorobiota bacterium]
MKKILVVVMSLFLLASCGSENTNNDKNDTDSNKQEVNTRPDGDHVITSYANGNAKVVKTFEVKDDKLIAVYEKEYYEDGALLKEGKLKNGKREGLWKSYRRDGILWSEGEYSTGLRNGITTTYHPNGKVYYRGSYTNGSKSGRWEFFNNEGEKVKEENFDKK